MLLTAAARHTTARRAGEIFKDLLGSKGLEAAECRTLLVDLQYVVIIWRSSSILRHLFPTITLKHGRGVQFGPEYDVEVKLPGLVELLSPLLLPGTPRSVDQVKVITRTWDD